MAIRKRMKRQDEPGGVRFLTFSCYRRMQLFGTPAIREVFAAALARASSDPRVQIIAWVVMPEHVHLLVRIAEKDVLAAWVEGVKKSVAKTVLARWKQLGAPVLEHIQTSSGEARFWQPGGGFDRRCRTITEISKEICYIHDNPVERGLVPVADDWAWSSMAWWRSGGEVCPFGVLGSWPPGGGRRDWKSWRGYVSRQEQSA